MKFIFLASLFISQNILAQIIESTTETSSSTFSEKISFDNNSTYFSYGFSTYNDITSTKVVEHTLAGDYVFSNREDRDWSFGAGLTTTPLNSIRNPNLSISYTNKQLENNKLTLIYEFSWYIQPVPNSISLPEEIILSQNKLSANWITNISDSWTLIFSATGYLFDRNLSDYLRTYTLIGLASRTGRILYDTLNNVSSWDSQFALYWYLTDDYFFKTSYSISRLALAQTDSTTYYLSLTHNFTEQLSLGIGASNSISPSGNSLSYSLNLAYNL